MSAFDLVIPAVKSWSRKDCATFCKVADENGLLSNMANGLPLTVSGERWASSEAWYQARRYHHLPEAVAAIRAAGNAWLAKQEAREWVAQTRADWDAVKMEAMAFALTAKLANPRFRAALAATGDKPIVELSMRDGWWGAQPRGGDLVGRNALGVLLMQLRGGARLREFEGETTEVVEEAAKVVSPSTPQEKAGDLRSRLLGL